MWGGRLRPSPGFACSGGAFSQQVNQSTVVREAKASRALLGLDRAKAPVPTPSLNTPSALELLLR